MIKNSEEDRSRLAESIETSLYLSNGLVEIEEIDEKVSHYIHLIFLAHNVDMLLLS